MQDVDGELKIFNLALLLLSSGLWGSFIKQIESRRIYKEADIGLSQSKKHVMASTRAVENTIRETSDLLFKHQVNSDEANQHICLELPYLKFSSISVSSKCIMFYEQPRCKGPVSRDENSVFNFGKSRSGGHSITPCLIESKSSQKHTSQASSKNSSALTPVTIRDIDAVDSSISSTASSDGNASYDLPDFPDEGEFDPRRHLKERNEIPLVTSLTTRRPATSTILVVANRSEDILKSNASDASLTLFSTNRRREEIDNELLRPHAETHAVICPRKCEATDQYGTHWEVCLSGTGFRSCPENYHGNVVWQCGSDGKFVQPMPNYSECHSNWVTEAESSVLVLSPAQRTHSLKRVAKMVLEKVHANRSSAEIRRPQYFGHEIPGILSLVDRVKDLLDEEDLDEAESLCSSSVMILESVASEPETWSQLPTEQRAATGTQLIQTMESTLFGLAKAGKKSGREKYSKVFNRSPNMHVRVDSFKRSVEEADFPGQDSKEPLIKLPRGWTSLAPQDDEDDEIHCVRMTISVEYVKNIIPSSKWDSIGKTINSQLATFSIANKNNTAATTIHFTDGGIEITFPHDAEAWGTEESIRVPRRLHSGEKPTAVLSSAMCVYWDTETLDWSSEGCRLVESGRLSTTCECKHLTSFAVLMDIHEYIGKDTGIILLTRLLCTVSCIFLLVTIIIFKKLHSVRNPRSSVTIHLCFCLLFGNIMILTLMDRDNFPLPNGFCAFVGMATHFIFLSAFAWMGIEGFIVYKMVVDVFESGTENKIRLRLIAYGVPMIIVFIFLIVHVSGGSVYGGEVYCWIQGHYIWSFIVPIIFVCCMNSVVLIIALNTAFSKNAIALQAKHSVQQSVKQARTMIVGTLSLTCLLGLTWISGFLLTIPDSNTATLGAYFFTILNASQGIFIFIFHVWLNKQVRTALKRRVTAWQSTVVSMDNTKTPNKRRSEPSVVPMVGSSSATNTTASTGVSSAPTHAESEEGRAMLPVQP